MKVAIIFFMLSVVFISTLATEGQNEAAEVQDQLAAGRRDHYHRDHHNRHHHRRHHPHHRHHDRHHDRHHHKHHDRVCSVQTDYWLPGIHEKRSCRNTANGNTDDCEKCCIAAYKDRHNYASGEGVTGFISNDPKDKDHDQCVCCTPKERHCHMKLEPLTWRELRAYGHAFDNETTGAGYPTKFGKVDFLPTEDGFVATCECEKRSGDECWLEFDNGLESFLTRNATAWSSKADSNGRFDRLSSTLITCDDGQNFINGTSVTHFTCQSWNNIN